MGYYFRSGDGTNHRTFESWLAAVYPEGLPSDSWLATMLATYPNPSPERLEQWQETFAYIALRSAHYGVDPRQGWSPEPPPERVREWREIQALRMLSDELEAYAEVLGDGEDAPTKDPETLPLSDAELDALMRPSSDEDRLDRLDPRRPALVDHWQGRPDRARRLADGPAGPDLDLDANTGAPRAHRQPACRRQGGRTFVEVIRFADATPGRSYVGSTPEPDLSPWAKKGDLEVVAQNPAASRGARGNEVTFSSSVITGGRRPGLGPRPSDYEESTQ